MPTLFVSPAIQTLMDVNTYLVQHNSSYPFGRIYICLCAKLAYHTPWDECIYACCFSERSAVLRVRTRDPDEVESEAAEQLLSRMLAASLLALQLPRAKVR